MGQASLRIDLNGETEKESGMFRIAVKCEGGAMNGEIGMAGNICTMRRMIARVSTSSSRVCICK